MVDIHKVRKVISKRIEIQPDDPKIYSFWEELKDILTVSQYETIIFLNKCTADEIYWISEVFEDISLVFNSKEFINCLEEL